MWVNKNGEATIRTYQYKDYKKKSGRAKRSKLLVGKNGRIGENNKKNLEKYFAEIDANPEFSQAEKISLKNMMKAKINDAKKEGKSLSIKSAESQIAKTKQEKYIINLGYEADDLARELNIDVEDLLDPKNWDNDTLTVGGIAWQFRFNYEGDAYVRQ